MRRWCTRTLMRMTCTINTPMTFRGTAWSRIHTSIGTRRSRTVTRTTRTCITATTTELQTDRSALGLFRVRIEYALVVKVHDAGGRAHQPGMKKQVEKNVALKPVERKAQQALDPELWVGTDEPRARIFAAPAKVIGDGMPRSKAVLQSVVNSAGSHRRHHPGSVPCEQDATRGNRPDDTSARNHAGPHGGGPQAAQVQDRRDLGQKLVHRLDRRAPPVSNSSCEAHLSAAG